MNYLIKTVSSKEELEKTFDFYKMIFNGVIDIENPEYSIEKWEERMKNHSDLMFYAYSGNKIIAIVFGRINDNKDMSITMGPVAVHENYRASGIAKEMILLLEKQAMANGIQRIDLGAVEAAERFYRKLGYTGSLLIQSQSHSIDQLLSLKNKYKLKFTNVYDNKVSQVCLELNELDKDLQREYERTFPGCYTMMLYQKNIGNINLSFE